MNAPNFELEEIFARAIERPAGHRLDWVRTRCGNDLELFEAVMDLVRGHEKNNQDNFLGEQIAGPFELPHFRLDRSDPRFDSSAPMASKSMRPFGKLQETSAGPLDHSSSDAASRAAYLESSSHQSALHQSASKIGPASKGNSSTHDSPSTQGISSFGSTKFGPRKYAEQIGDQIGRYQLLEKIGEGGMGTVYLAQQTSDVRRKVALKIIKLGMDSKQVCNRFENERQAMAMFNHPHIAKVLDAGSTEQGRPYFVMEWVQGKTITKHCQENELDLRGRLELFLQLCKAIRHAHQKGIIHRDLKPGNILVTQIDEKPHPKVIDFGIAKALSDDLFEAGSDTGSSALIGTPQYMSPEQARFGQIEIDQRSDVYSLGIVLYELLTGQTPLDGETLKKANPLALFETIENAVFKRPSAILKDLGKSGKEAVTLPVKPKQIKGSLDKVAMKAIAFDPDKRYESVEQLANDVQCVLNGDPVSAQGPSPFGFLKRTFLRHKVSMATGALLTLFCITTVITCLYLASEARQSSIAHAETIKKLKSKSNELEALGKEIQTKNKTIDFYNHQLRAEMKKRDEDRLKEILATQTAQYHQAHLQAINQFVDQINAEANAIQMELVAKHFGNEVQQKVLQDLYQTGRLHSTASKDDADQEAFQLSGRQHFPTSIQNQDGSQLIPKIRWVQWEFESLDVLDFVQVDYERMDKPLARIIGTLETKRALLAGPWSHRPTNITDKNTGMLQHFLRDHPDLGPTKPNTHPSMDRSKKQFCCKFHEELSRKFHLLSKSCKPRFYKILVKKYQAEFGADDPRVADAYDLLAASYIDVGNIPKARRQLFIAKRLRQQAIDTENPLHQPHINSQTTDYLSRFLDSGLNRSENTSRQRKSRTSARISQTIRPFQLLFKESV